MYRWVAEPDAPDDVGIEQEFASQSEAEQWLAAFWEELADAGVAAVTLQEGGRVVYGPMPLSPA